MAATHSRGPLCAAATPRSALSSFSRGAYQKTDIVTVMSCKSRLAPARILASGCSRRCGTYVLCAICIALIEMFAVRRSLKARRERVSQVVRVIPSKQGSCGRCAEDKRGIRRGFRQSTPSDRGNRERLDLGGRALLDGADRAERRRSRLLSELCRSKRDLNQYRRATRIFGWPCGLVRVAEIANDQ